MIPWHLWNVTYQLMATWKTVVLIFPNTFIKILLAIKYNSMSILLKPSVFLPYLAVILKIRFPNTFIQRLWPSKSNCRLMTISVFLPYFRNTNIFAYKHLYQLITSTNPDKEELLILIANWRLRNKFQWNFNQNGFFKENAFEMWSTKLQQFCSSPNSLDMMCHCDQISSR